MTYRGAEVYQQPHGSWCWDDEEADVGGVGFHTKAEAMAAVDAYWREQTGEWPEVSAEEREWVAGLSALAGAVR